MRSVRLEREFDAVFVHDAIAYMTSRDDLLRAMRTARAHCRPGGVALFAPDDFQETFAPGTSHGGRDGDGRALAEAGFTDVERMRFDHSEVEEGLEVFLGRAGQT